MAKTGVFEGDQGMSVKLNELKKELYKAVQAINGGEDDINVDAIDMAQNMLNALKDLKLERCSSSISLNLQNQEKSVVVPEEFRCPLSKELMKDPVIVSTGQTFDRPFIQKWINSGNRMCPQTQQVLSHTILTPNHLIREMISQWCKKNRIQLPDPDRYSKDEGLREADKDLFLSLLDKLSKTLSDQKEAAKELRSLTKRMPSFRALFGESSDALPQLLKPLSQSNSLSDVHPDLQEDIITTVLNLSIHDNNKKPVAETPMVISLLIDALRSGTIQTRTNAAAALFTLSALDSNKALIGKSGALKPLIDLLDEGNSLAMKDAASAIFTLCILHENRARSVRDGAVQVLLTKIADRVYVDELLAILAMLSNNQKAVEELGDLGGVSCFLLTEPREFHCHPPHNLFQ
ncbi:hypothetical protein Leryth_003324 [Lithospermum erythrorhizon]|nr:hypothetical protein Leryth_003324 [Lithospermum erythrorhizon]